MDMLEEMSRRRSVRVFNDVPVTKEQLERILKAGMLGPTGKGIFPYSFTAVTDPSVIRKLVGCRQGGAKMLKTAKAAIVVSADTAKSDTCVEDCSVCMTQMHLMASSMGLGSCWLQIRLRPSDEEGTSSEDFVRKTLGLPEGELVEAILAIGNIDKAPDAHEIDKLPLDKVHWEKW